MLLLASAAVLLAAWLSWLSPPYDAGDFYSRSLAAVVGGNKPSPPPQPRVPTSPVFTAPPFPSQVQSTTTSSLLNFRARKPPRRGDDVTVFICRLVGNVSFPLQGVDQYSKYVDGRSHHSNIPTIQNLLSDGTYFAKDTKTWSFDGYFNDGEGAFNADFLWQHHRLSQQSQVRVKNLYLVHRIYNSTLEA